MITLKVLDCWLAMSAESEHIEFKEAKAQYDTTKLMRYCVALANEGGGYFVLGVTDKLPRQVVGTKAFLTATALNDIKSRIVDKLHIRVDTVELSHPLGRVLVFVIPPRPIGHPLHMDGAYLMRAGEDLVSMTQDQLRRIFDEGKPDWFTQPAKNDASSDDVIALLDTQSYFELLSFPYPTDQNGVLARLSGEGLITKCDSGWIISNLAAILLAKRIDSFSLSLARKAPRVVIYDGIDKTQTREDKPFDRGYAVGFESLIDFIHSAAPLNKSVEKIVREEVKMFPKQALRELIANALVHQDFNVSGTSVMIEMFVDRIEISNPGKPPISVERFIDEYRSVNERLADLMRRLGICEEKGSGVDKVVKAAEVCQLPAPEFRVGEIRTTAILYAHQEFENMSKSDRVRACYQHCCLMYVSNQRMSNQSLRQRFGVQETKVATVSLVITATRELELIKLDESETTSTRYAKYLPFWA
jgi:ATP-dependent DNA helicase RecG